MGGHAVYIWINGNTYNYRLLVLIIWWLQKVSHAPLVNDITYYTTCMQWNRTSYRLKAYIYSWLTYPGNIQACSKWSIRSNIQFKVTSKIGYADKNDPSSYHGYIRNKSPSSEPMPPVIVHDKLTRICQLLRQIPKLTKLRCKIQHLSFRTFFCQFSVILTAKSL